MNSRGRATFYVHIEVRTPAKLTKEQRTLLETLSRTLPAGNQPKEAGLFDKVKDNFV